MALTLRAPLTLVEPVTGGTPNLRASLILTGSVTGGTPNLRAALVLTESVTGGNPNLRAALIVVQAVIPMPRALIVTTSIFPSLLGLQFAVKKNPEFNSKIDTAASGKEIATAFMQYPWWHFEFQTDYMPDVVLVGSPAYTDLQTLQGFFMQMQGSYGAFLYCDPDDHHVVGGAIATADGVTLQWPFFRNFGGFSEPVGQVDLRSLATFLSSAVNTGTNSITIPGHGFTTGQYPPIFISNTGGSLPTGVSANTPYWPIVVDANTIKLATTEANALANTPVTLSATGSGTDTLSKGYAIYDNGAIVNPASASLTLPNQIVFGVAPTTGHAITADFDFYFTCRFEDNVTDFDRFAQKLWTLGKLKFKSIIQ